MKTQEHPIRFVPMFDEHEQLFWPTVSTKVRKKVLDIMIKRGFVCKTLDECGNLCTELNKKIFEVSANLTTSSVIENI